MNIKTHSNKNMLSNAKVQKRSKHIILALTKVNIQDVINDLIETTRKHWGLTHSPVRHKLKSMNLTVLVSPQCDAEFRTLNKYTGVNTPLIGFFYVHSKALALIMVGCVSDFGRWFPVFHSTNLHTLPPNSFRTVGGSFFNLQEII